MPCIELVILLGQLLVRAVNNLNFFFENPISAIPKYLLSSWLYKGFPGFFYRPTTTIEDKEDDGMICKRKGTKLIDSVLTVQEIQCVDTNIKS